MDQMEDKGKHHMSLINKAFFLIALMSISACSELKLQLDSSEYLNTGPNKQSLPVFVKIYQLNEDYRFKTSTFKQLWKNDERALGSSLLSKKEFVVSPGTHADMSLTIEEGAKFIAAMAVFRQPHNNQWRVIESLPPKAFQWGQKIQIGLEGNTLKITSD